MPPQPLSNVRSTATVFVGASSTTYACPALARLVAEALATWGDIEYQFAGMLTTMLGATAAPAVAMFNALTSSVAQIAALEGAASVALGPTSREY